MNKINRMLLTGLGLPLIMAAAITAANPNYGNPGPSLLFEMMGTDYCETIPIDYPMEELKAEIEAMQAEGQPLLEAEAEGFMAGDLMGFSLFGTRHGDNGFGAVHSMWAEVADVGLATLCILTVQIGEEKVAAGRFDVIDPEAAGEPTEPGQFIALGIVISLTPSGDQTDEGRNIYRQNIIGEVMFASGFFELTAFSDDGYSGTMSLDGKVRLDDHDEPMAIRLDADIKGMPGLQNFPHFTPED